MDYKTKKTLVLYFIIFLAFVFLVGCSEKNFNGNLNVEEKDFSIESFEDEQGVKAIFFSDTDGNIYKFIVYGETNYSEYGTDIVASAVSVLTINTINSIDLFANVEMEYESKKINEKPYVECIIKKFNSEQGKHEALVLMKSLKSGLYQIEDAYGSEYINVIEFK